MNSVSPIFPIVLRRTILIGKGVACLVLTTVSVYVILLAVEFVLLSRELYLRNVVDDKSKNGRGDVVFAETDTSAGETHPWKTVIWLRQARHLFSTTLLEANSFDVSVGLKWQDADHLLLRLDFGCDAAHSIPRERVGPIHVTYRFGDSGRAAQSGDKSQPHLSRRVCD